MIRAFVAIALPAGVLEHCESISDRLKKLDLKGRFSRPESIHLTLKFLGNIKEEQVSAIADVLRRSAQESAPFELSAEGVGVFPHLGNPRVIWVGIKPSEELREIQEKIETRLEDLGFAREKRDFHPHLTLARLKSRKNVEQLIAYIKEEGAREKAGSILVDAVHLYQSILKRSGAEYRQLVTARFGGTAKL